MSQKDPVAASSTGGKASSKAKPEAPKYETAPKYKYFNYETNKYEVPRFEIPKPAVPTPDMEPVRDQDVEETAVKRVPQKKRQARRQKARSKSPPQSNRRNLYKLFTGDNFYNYLTLDQMQLQQEAGSSRRGLKGLPKRGMSVEDQFTHFLFT